MSGRRRAVQWRGSRGDAGPRREPHLGDAFPEKSHRRLDVLRRLVETKHKLTKTQRLAFEAEQPRVWDELKQMLTEVRHDGNAGSDE